MTRLPRIAVLLLALVLPSVAQEPFLAATLTQVDDDGRVLVRPMVLRCGDNTLDATLRLPAELVFADEDAEAEEGFDLAAYAAADAAAFMLEGGYYVGAGRLHLEIASVGFESASEDDLAAWLAAAARAAAGVEAQAQGISEADVPAFEAQIVALFLTLFEPEALATELAALFSQDFAFTMEGDTVFLTDGEGGTSRWQRVVSTAVGTLGWAQAKRHRVP